MSRNDGILRQRHGTKFMMVKELGFLFLILALTHITKGADPIFSEGGGGGAIPYQLEEEILEELAKGQQQETKNDEIIGVSDNAGKPPSKTEDVISDVNIKEPPPPAPRPTAPVAAPPSDSVAQNRPPAPAGGTNAKQQYDELKSAAAAAIMKQTSSLQQKPAKVKKEGQEEFATFVDPFSQPNQNRRLNAEKQTYNGHMGHEAKRAQMHAAGPGQAEDLGDTVFIAVTTVCSAAAVFGLIGAGVCWYRLHKQYKAAQDVEYPHYGVTGPSKERTSGNTSPVAAMDAKLASSAQLYHYQHTKQQIIAMEHSTSDAKGQESEDSEGEGDEGDYSVYECPGLAPTGDIEVSNPLFENMGAASPRPQAGEGEHQSPRVHQRSPVRGEDP